MLCLVCRLFPHCPMLSGKDTNRAEPQRLDTDKVLVRIVGNIDNIGWNRPLPVDNL